MGWQGKNHRKTNTLIIVATESSHSFIKSSFVTFKKEGRKEGRTLNNNKKTNY
jgi:hypothetical protein